MLGLSKKPNLNYLAQIVKLERRIEHPNADRLRGWVVSGCVVWTDTTYEVGDDVVFFPLECQIAHELISGLNLYREKELNSDPEKAGYFEKNRRVKAVKLRGKPCAGFILKVSELQKVFGDFVYNVGQEFDTINDVLLCQKYTIPVKPQKQGVSKKKAVRLVNLIAENQFRLHYDTSPLAKHEYLLQKGRWCAITYKLHGTSLVSSNLLTVKSSWWRDILVKFGWAKPKYEYEEIYSSRKVVKKVGSRTNANSHYYKTDVWGVAHESIRHALVKGLTIYAEVVGYTPDGAAIQKDYDYGVPEGKCDVYVYRITFTNVDGVVFEFGWNQVKAWCETYGINYVPELYYGPVDFNLEELREKYLEKDCFLCSGQVPAEGITLRIESSDDPKWYKFKSFRFFEKETKDLDQGLVSIEDEQSVEEE